MSVLMEKTVDADLTFVPWYAGRPLVSPYDGMHKKYQHRARLVRLSRIEANVAASPSRSLFVWQEKAA